MLSEDTGEFHGSYVRYPVGLCGCLQAFHKTRVCLLLLEPDRGRFTCACKAVFHCGQHRNAQATLDGGSISVDSVSSLTRKVSDMGTAQHLGATRDPCLNVRTEFSSIDTTDLYRAAQIIF
jgi:hypothetical protein